MTSELTKLTEESIDYDSERFIAQIVELQKQGVFKPVSFEDEHLVERYWRKHREELKGLNNRCINLCLRFGCVTRDMVVKLLTDGKLYYNGAYDHLTTRNFGRKTWIHLMNWAKLPIPDTSCVHIRADRMNRMRQIIKELAACREAKEVGPLIVAAQQFLQE